MGENMKLFVPSFLIIFSLFLISNLFANDKVIAFFEYAPQEARNDIDPESTLKLGGIPVIYGGYVSYNKKLEFPLRHSEQKLYIVVTPEISVKQTQGNTVSSLAITKMPGFDVYLPQTIKKDTQNKNTQTPKIYLLEKKKDSKQCWFWHASEQKLPQNGRLESISLIIINNPDNIFVKLGDTMANEEAHLRLPPLYVVGDKNRDINLIRFSNLEKYFEPISAKTQSETDPTKNGPTSTITTNLQ